MKVSFHGIGENVVTFYNSKTNGAAAAVPVKMSGSGEVSKCLDGERFFGVSIDGDTEFVAVQTGGYAELSYTGTAPAIGFVKLAANGAGGVKAAETGGEFLVIKLDTSSKLVGIML